MVEGLGEGVISIRLFVLQVSGLKDRCTFTCCRGLVSRVAREPTHIRIQIRIHMQAHAQYVCHVCAYIFAYCLSTHTHTCKHACANDAL